VFLQKLAIICGFLFYAFYPTTQHFTYFQGFSASSENPASFKHFVLYANLK